MTRHALAVLALSTALALSGFAQTAAKPAPKPSAKSAVSTSQAKSPAKPADVSPGAWQKIPIPPLAPFHPQEPKRIELKNGMVIFLQEDHELPFIGGTATVRGGGISEPANKAGLVDIYGDVWRTGGTRTKTGDELDDFLEARAAHIETSGGGQSTSVSFNCLKTNLDEIFPVWLELLRDPAFREDKLELAKLQMNTGISRRNDDVGSISSREATRLAYGKDNPYARIPEYSTVAAITRDDLVKWHDEHVQPNNILIGISGDFDATAMEQRLRKAFDSWQRASVPPKPEIKFEDPKPGIYFVAKDDVNQSDISMVTLGIERSNPDYFAVQVMNEVLGGGFSSRLMKSIRTEKGLAYSVGGGIGAAFDHPGVFSVSMGTKSSNTVDAIKALREEVANLLTHPATAAEVKDAKDAILNRFIFNFDSKGKVLGERTLYEFYGYPADFLERYRTGIEKTTPADVDRVAHKYVHPEQFAVLVVGNDKEFVKPLTQLGQVTPIDITIPEPGAQATGARSAPKQNSPEARALAEKVASFMGGAGKLAAVESIRQVSTIEQQTPQGPMTLESDTYTVPPEQSVSIVRTQRLPAPMHLILTPAGAWMSVEGMGSQAMPASMKQDRVAAIHRDPIYLLQHLGDAGVTVSMGDKAADGQTIEISGDGVNVRWVIDPQSGRLVKSAFTATGQQGPVQRTVEYSDWRDASGIKLPFKREVTENGKPSGTETVKSFEINPTIDPKLFEKPAAGPPQ